MASFLFETLTEVRSLLLEEVGGLLEFTQDVEAPEYDQTRGRWPEAADG